MKNQFNFTTNSSVLSTNESQYTIRSPSTHSIFKQMARKIKQVQYPTSPIKQVNPIQDWIQRAESSKLKHCLNKTLKTDNGLKYLRKIRGDGNCFIRAIAFEYLAQMKSTKFQICFPYLKSVILTCSQKEYIPKSFLPFYEHEFLSYLLKQNWQFLYQQSLKQNFYNYKLSLASLLEQNPYLDFIIVLYIRAVSVLALRKFQNDSHIANFLQDNDEDKLRNYGNHSDGLTQFLLYKILRIQMQIFQVREQQVLVYLYPGNDGQISPIINLLFHHNHYDLLETQADMRKQLNKLKIQENQSFQTGQSFETIVSQCINCQQFVPIYVQSYLCESCYIQSKSVLDEFSKSKITYSDEQKYDQQNPQIKKKSANKLKNDNIAQKKPRKIKKQGIFGCFG